MENKREIGLIVARSENNVIGKGGRIPWDIEGELSQFKELTMGNAVVMGRRTYEEIGHPLPGDFLYHPDFTLISRQPLHSRRMSFLHPITREPLCFTASLPGDMQALLVKAGPGEDALLRLLD